MASRKHPRTSSTRRPAAGRAAGLSGTALKKRWPALHRGDQEPFPGPARIVALAASSGTLRQLAQRLGGADALAGHLQQAWTAFHQGRFPEAIRIGSAQGYFGATVANKAAAIHSLYARLGAEAIVALLNEAAERGESAVRVLPEEANVHYTLALVLGRYSQRVSILRALTQGIAERLRSHLERTLELQPRHAEANIALGLYHAEIVSKLGSIAASLTYQASSQAAIRHFEQAVKLAPDSPIALMEYAHGLRLLDAAAHGRRIVELYERAAVCQPLDAIDELDARRAREELADLQP